MSKFKIIVDCRENKIIEYFTNNNVNIEVKNLFLGDIVIVNEEDKPILVVERKTLKDMIASIKDGRYHEQKYRLVQNYSKKQIVYIIENYNNFQMLKDQSLESSIIHSVLRDNVNMFFTKNENDTGYLISSIYRRIEKNPQYFIDDCDDRIIKNYNNASLKKSTNYTDIQMKLFTQIPGVSNNTAKALLDEFKSISNMIKRYYEEDTNNIKIELNKLKVNGRKINGNAVDNIIINLFHKNE